MPRSAGPVLGCVILPARGPRGGQLLPGTQAQQCGNVPGQNSSPAWRLKSTKQGALHPAGGCWGGSRPGSRGTGSSDGSDPAESIFPHPQLLSLCLPPRQTEQGLGDVLLWTPGSFSLETSTQRCLHLLTQIVVIIVVFPPVSAGNVRVWMNSWRSPPASLCPAFPSQLCGFPWLCPRAWLLLGQGVSSGCVGGSFSSVTLALLETPAEKVPDFFQPWENPLGPLRQLQSSWTPTSDHHRRCWIAAPRAAVSWVGAPCSLCFVWGLRVI